MKKSTAKKPRKVDIRNFIRVYPKQADSGLIRIPLVPIPKPRMTRHDTWKPAAQRYFEFSDRLRCYQPDPDWEGLVLHFIMPMPKSWPKSKKEKMNGELHRQVPDLDNLVKAFQDSILENDSEVAWYKDVRKIWGLTGAIEFKPKTGE